MKILALLQEHEWQWKDLQTRLLQEFTLKEESVSGARLLIYTCRLACPRLNDSGSKENLRHNCATIVRVLRHNCSAAAQQSPVRLCVSRGGHRYFRPDVQD